MDLLEARAATAEMGVKTLTLNTIPATVQTDDYWRRELCMSEITNSDMLVNQCVRCLATRAHFAHHLVQSLVPTPWLSVVQDGGEISLHVGH